ncbi:MAG: hypothetical protein GYA48_04835 [Chloroflexi bacterium]|nr:hypothetical protein [Chloroflexota bacterium]
MSQQEKMITVSFTSHILILGYYLYHLWLMVQSGGLVSSRLFSLWALVIATIIIVNIIGNILTNILLAIFHAVKTQRAEEPPASEFIEDERDKLISLKGTRVTYITFSFGVLAAMLTFAFGQPPLMMFGLLILSSIVAEIAGDISQMVLYRMGF